MQLDESPNSYISVKTFNLRLLKLIFKSVLRNAATNKLKPPYLQVQFFKYAFKI